MWLVHNSATRASACQPHACVLALNPGSPPSLTSRGRPAFAFPGQSNSTLPQEIVALSDAIANWQFDLHRLSEGTHTEKAHIQDIGAEACLNNSVHAWANRCLAHQCVRSLPISADNQLGSLIICCTSVCGVPIKYDVDSQALPVAERLARSAGPLPAGHLRVAELSQKAQKHGPSSERKPEHHVACWFKLSGRSEEEGEGFPQILCWAFRLNRGDLASLQRAPSSAVELCGRPCWPQQERGHRAGPNGH
jgi:hypothetical protein